MTDCNKFDPSELTSEKKLWDIYKKSRNIPLSKFNMWTSLLVLVLLSINAWITRQPLSETVDLIRKSADSGLSISLNTLGFLLAGFTIFATVSKPSLSLKMAEIYHSESGLSYLKHNYFIFIRVFIYYIAFAVFCLTILMFGHKSGLVSTLISKTTYPDCLRYIVIKVSYIAIFAGYFFLIIQLKTFTFNIYHAVMTSLRWKAETKNADE